jgi:cold shock CspA family protein
MKGTVIDLTGRNKGYGFIMDEQGNPRFFHARDMREPGAFNRLKLPDDKGNGGDVVEFEPTQATGKDARGNGLRANDVRVTG